MPLFVYRPWRAFFTALAVGMFAVVSLAQAQSSSCEIAGCDTASWYAGPTTTVYLPGYPNCPIEVLYNYRECPDGRIVIDLYSIGYHVTLGCEEMDAKTLNPDGSINEGFWEWRFQQAFWQLAQQLFMNKYNGLFPWDKWRMECPNGQQLYTATWGSCERRFYYKLSPSPHSKRYISRIRCGDVCCRENLVMCYNPQTQTLEMQHNFDGEARTDCATLPPPQPPPHWIILASTQCVAACKARP